MEGSVVLYRGSLKSCNYQCSYCPFSKHQMSERELEKDREQWFRFVESLVGEKPRKEHSALMVVPYGEALIHPWYWEGMARVAKADWIDGVGAQTNLSFPLRSSLECFEKAGGRLEKLRLWATFHPEMVKAEEFAEKCRRVQEAGILLSVGGVGVPGHEQELRKLRRLLPESVYLWINKMDGLGRKYTETEKEAFSEMDPYFWRELLPVTARIYRCGKRIFVEGDGRQRLCNIGKVAEGNWYEPEKSKMWPLQECGRKWCSCYLAYGGRSDWENQVLFGPYPIFRIPRHPKAVFLDIDGTLVPGRTGKGLEGSKRDLAEETSAWLTLQTLKKEGALLFFATTLPYKDAKRRCQKVWHMFAGGIFAGGAHVLLNQEGQRREHFYFLDEGWVSRLKPWEKKYGFRALAFRKEGRLYKLTLFRPLARPWDKTDAEKIRLSLGPEGQGEIRWIREENCLQLVAARAGKAKGVRMVCGWLGISPAEAAAAGDSEEDQEMIRLTSLNGRNGNGKSIVSV